jgi:hypothetical protein
MTQSALNILEQRALERQCAAAWNATSMFDVAQLVGDARLPDGPYLLQNNIDSHQFHRRRPAPRRAATPVRSL